jgi:hypothetical protein
MINRSCCILAVILATLILVLNSQASGTDQLVVKDCPELLRMAQSLQDDVKTIDTVLGSAIEVGNMATIQNYKMKKASVQIQLQSVLKAIEIRSCVKNK